MRIRGAVVRERIEPAARVAAAITVVAALADESRNSCGGDGANGALLIAAAVTAGLALALHASRRRGPWLALTLGLATAAGVAAVLVVLATLTWVHNCAN